MATTLSYLESKLENDGERTLTLVAPVVPEPRNPQTGRFRNLVALDDLLKSKIVDNITQSFSRSNEAEPGYYTPKELEAFNEEYPIKFNQYYSSTYAMGLVLIGKGDDVANYRVVASSFLATGKEADEPTADNGVKTFLWGNYVNPDYQGQGFSKGLLMILAPLAVKNGFEHIDALATTFSGTLAVYNKLGFDLLGRTTRPSIIAPGIEFPFEQIRLDLRKFCERYGIPLPPNSTPK